MASFGLANIDAANAAAAVNTTNIDASTPWIAASEGNLPLLQNTLNVLQLSPSAADENGYTLVHAAASYNQIHILEWLLSQSSNTLLHAQDQEGDSCLHYAGNDETARWLIGHHANPKLLNAEGKTALQAKYDEMQEMMQDEDFEEDDDDYIALKGVVEYLKTLF